MCSISGRALETRGGIQLAPADLEHSEEPALPSTGCCSEKGGSVIQHFMNPAFREIRQRRR